MFSALTSSRADILAGQGSMVCVQVASEKFDQIKAQRIASGDAEDSSDCKIPSLRQCSGDGCSVDGYSGDGYSRLAR
jgi:hypothetical protein